jgi:PAS domain S-box-containing protein
VVVILVLFVLAMVVTFASLFSASQYFVKREAVDSAQTMAQTLLQARDLYSNSVIKRIQELPGVQPTHDYQHQPQGIPIPATFLIELSQEIAQQNPAMTARYFSDYPFPWRQTTGGPRDQFEQKALSVLRNRPDQPFSQIETYQGRLSIRYAVADRMKPTCVACHNSHPDSPKKDWRVGDVRGVLEVSYPLDEFQTHINQSFAHHLGWFLLTLGLGLVGLLVGFRVSLDREMRLKTNVVLQQANTELEQRVAERTRDLQRQQEWLKLQERAITASRNGIIIVDARLPDNPTIFVNPAFEKMTGYSAQEVLGKNCRFLQGQENAQVGLQSLRQALKSGSSCKVILRNYRRDGSPFWNELNISPIQDDQGQLTHFIGIQQDVSARIQSEESLKESLREKEILLKEIHHRVKNNLLVVSSLLNWQSEATQDPDILKIFEDSQKRLTTIALIHEKLYRSADLSHIDLGEYLSTLARQILESFRADRNLVTLLCDCAAIPVNIETASPCGLIVNELVVNALEHAFPEARPGRITLTLQQDEKGLIQLALADDGIGFPETIDIHQTESLGWQLVCLLTEQLEGQIHLYSPPGTRIVLTFSELLYHARI